MRTAVVTGAASGIGRATALRLAQDGYGVALVDIDETGMEATLRSIESAAGAGRAFRADVSDAHQLGVMLREVVSTMGSPELLVNVAGITIAADGAETVAHAATITQSRAVGQLSFDVVGAMAAGARLAASARGGGGIS